MISLSRTWSALLLFILFAASSIGTAAPDEPVRGKSFTITYNAAPGKAFGASLNLVYAFDYWGTNATDDRSPSALFANVLDPSPERVHTVPMTGQGGTFTATIDIPGNVSLLSYYVTDGRTRDDNDSKTFVRYICDENGKPVMGARFRNIDFMVIAGQSASEQTEELQNELAEYPQNHVAYIPYWMLRFQAAKSLEELQSLKPIFENTLALMGFVMSADTVQNVRAGIYFRYTLRLGALSGYGEEYRMGLKDLERRIESIPEEKRFWFHKGILTGLKEGRYNHE